MHSVWRDFGPSLRAAALAITFLHASAAFAENPTPLTFVASGGLTHNFIRKLLPLRAKVSQGGAIYDIWFGDLYFCGAPQPGLNATVIGVAYPGQPVGPLSSPVINGSDCRDNFVGLTARRKALNMKPFLATKLSLTWSPWKLNFAVTQAVAVGNEVSQELTNLQAAIVSAQVSIAEFSTASLKFAMPGSGQLQLDAAVSFDRDSTQVTLFLANTTTVVPPPGLLDQMPPSTNGELRIPFDFANFILSSFAPDGGVVISDDSAGKVEFQHPQLIYSADSLLIKGVLFHVPTNQSFATTVSFSTTDLKLTSITLSPQYGNCSTSDLDCQMRNALINAVTPKIRDRLQKTYQNVPLQITSYDDPIAFVVLGTTMRARVRAVQESATQSGLDFKEIVSLEENK